MMKLHVPGTTIPGAARMMDPSAPVPVPLFDRRGRPVWDIPETHSRTVRHFQTRASRLAFERGDIPHEEATAEVRIYRGLGMRTLNKFRSQIQRATRKQKA